MAKRPKPQPKKRTTKHRLPACSGVATPTMISIGSPLLKFVITVLLIPASWIFTLALFSSFQHAATKHGFGNAVEFQCFAIGAAAWVLAFLASLWVSGDPLLLRVYVFAHELTHAFWSWLHGGKITKFKADADGGYIETTRTNFWIALTPYFHPLYSILVIEIYAVVAFFYDVSAFTPVLFGLLGLTWAFHFSFTLWMIPKGQSDLRSHGTIFSMLVIYFMNVVTLVALLIFAAPEVTFRLFGRELWRHFTGSGFALLNWIDTLGRAQ